MAGPFSIQKVPFGLQSFLDMKGTGQTPVDLAQQVLPIIDVTEAYGYPLQVQQETTLVNAVGDTAELTVPPQQVWRVIGVGIAAVTANAGDVIVGELTFRLATPTGGSLAFAPGVPVGPGTLGAAGVSESVGLMLPVPLWLPSGTTLRASVLALTAVGNVSLTPRALVQVLVS